VVKRSGHWKQNCRNRFCAYLHEKWIVLRQAYTEMILVGPSLQNNTASAENTQFFAIFVCLSVTSITYLSFNQNWNEVKSSYFTYRLLLTLVNGEVIVRLAVKKSELKITACETSVEIVFAYIRENRSIYIKLTQKWSLAHSTNIFNTFTSGNA